jgi:small-conductance mechanosensitive channel/CRP-like cAMP-binding protein
MENIPLETLKTVALALAWMAGSFLILRLILRFASKHKAFVKARTAANIAVFLLVILIFLWRMGLPAYNAFNQILTALVLLVAAYVGVVMGEYFLFDFVLSRRQEFPPSKLLRDVSRIAVLLLILFLVVSGVFKLDLTTILVSSAVFSAVIGLALQDILGNVISGVALHIERPFQVGDWVEVADQRGEVVEMSWRATRIRTLENNYVVIPNSNIAKERITNYKAPSPVLAQYLRVGTSYEAPPHKVKRAILEIAAQTSGVLKEPPPQVRTIDYGDFAIEYELKFWIDEYERHPSIQDDLKSRIWYQFKRVGIEIPFPIRTLRSMERVRQKEAERARNLWTEILDILKRCEIFTPLSEEQLVILSRNAKLLPFGTGEFLIVQGEKGDSLFIVDRGRVEISILAADGSKIALAELGPGESFGEVSLLTGEKRSATVKALEDTEAVVVTREDLRGIMQETPFLAESLSLQLEKRLREMEEKRVKDKGEWEKKTEIKEASVKWLRKIRKFFDL